jgi:alpha-tubulin suppressor-like RCC1 family protein
MLFEDKQGIKDLKFGLRHGIYIQQHTGNAFSWGERTFGQTGNNYQDNFFQFNETMSKATTFQQMSSASGRFQTLNKYS